MKSLVRLLDLKKPGELYKMTRSSLVGGCEIDTRKCMNFKALLRVLSCNGCLVADLVNPSLKKLATTKFACAGVLVNFIR